MARIARPLNRMARIWRTVIDEGANHQLFEGRVWESVRLARLSQGHHKGIRVTSATTLMYSHGRGARGAAVGLNSSRLVVTQVARTGKAIRLPMPAPAPHPSPRAAPHPTLLCLFNPDSTRSYQSTLSYRSSNVVHLNSPPMSFRAASRSLSAAPSSSRGRVQVIQRLPQEVQWMPQVVQ